MCGKNGGGKGGKVVGKAKSRSSRVGPFTIIFNSRVKLTCLPTERYGTVWVFLGGFWGEERVGRKNYIAYIASPRILKYTFFNNIHYLKKQNGKQFKGGWIRRPRRYQPEGFFGGVLGGRKDWT